MSRRAQEGTAVDTYAAARDQFDQIAQWLESRNCPAGHAELEDGLEQRMQELARRLFQGRVDRLFLEEQARILRGRRPPGEMRVRTRSLETRFGRVTVRRHGFRRNGVTSFPLDRGLRLPPEIYSHGLRKRVAEEVRTQSVANSVDRVDDTTAGHVPKRQAEELMVRAAQDFETFYANAERQGPANDESDPATLLIMSCDAKGIAVRAESLRDATRKEAERAQRDPVRGDPTSTRKDRRHTKRMAAVTAVWDQKPLARTAQDIVTELRGDPDAPKVRMPKPEKKRIAATIENSLPTAVAEMFDEADRRDPERRRTTGVLVDGSEPQLAAIRAEAARRDRLTFTIVVDLIHVLHYVWMAGMAIRRNNAKKADAWVRKYLFALLTKNPLEVISGIRQAATLANLTKEERAPVEKCLKYLRDNLPYIHYADFLARGFPIASGVIEGACRHLVQDRLGITGARWGLKSAEAVLRLRALRSNGDWEAYWGFHLEQEELRNAQQRAA
jgi:hypothetical protein